MNELTQLEILEVSAVDEPCLKDARVHLRKRDADVIEKSDREVEEIAKREALEAGDPQVLGVEMIETVRRPFPLDDLPTAVAKFAEERPAEFAEAYAKAREASITPRPALIELGKRAGNAVEAAVLELCEADHEDDRPLELAKRGPVIAWLGGCKAALREIAKGYSPGDVLALRDAMLAALRAALRDAEPELRKRSRAYDPADRLTKLAAFESALTGVGQVSWDLLAVARGETPEGS